MWDSFWILVHCSLCSRSCNSTGTALVYLWYFWYSASFVLFLHHRQDASRCCIGCFVKRSCSSVWSCSRVCSWPVLFILYVDPFKSVPVKKRFAHCALWMHQFSGDTQLEPKFVGLKSSICGIVSEFWFTVVWCLLFPFSSLQHT